MEQADVVMGCFDRERAHVNVLPESRGPRYAAYASSSCVDKHGFVGGGVRVEGR